MPDWMNRRRLAVAGTTALVVATGALAVNATTASADRGHARAKIARATLHSADGSTVGRVTLRQTRGKVVVKATARGLAPGFHGFHIHAVGRCDANAPDGPFTSAGGHYTGGRPNHGDHAGDLPSLLVTDNGRARLKFVTDRFTLRELRDADGSAVMVHAGRDNFANIPDRYSAAGQGGPDATTLATGDAGARAACGVLR
ncbi:superoxide dismutase family protein [Mumia sp. zg.B53]|uniref:superoxide dismutase family protein n=1 Tax=unclassified Mumia TaxID=2621872 RepID=UPI001C6E422D|nr:MULTISPECIES: superoxide dismutase family protein [unclassified Mumia]MBW9207380.1 superoxide dismutase family protein [Mumia sp. zg.B17]MBW9210272.1 superoxide dismutase family protein [Mumia sp. zg.B21]MBW9214882.1 superoxide dismutase family protein [Mumia sp. zg.B53]